jgi:hypothetical protein
MKRTVEQRIKISKGTQKLTTEQVNEIEELTKRGTMTQVAIARLYRVSPPLVARIKKGGYTRYSERVEQGVI